MPGSIPAGSSIIARMFGADITLSSYRARHDHGLITQRAHHGPRASALPGRNRSWSQPGSCGAPLALVRTGESPCT